MLGITFSFDLLFSYREDVGKGKDVGKGEDVGKGKDGKGERADKGDDFGKGENTFVDILAKIRAGVYIFTIIYKSFIYFIS